MPKVRFILHNGKEHTVTGDVGDSAMQTAVDNAVPGIIGDCGGNCSCATCHGYIDADWLDKLSPISEDEAAILEGAMHVESNSRLTCQVKLSEELDGIVIRLPISQV
jgi:ferredoxin, 2Fe-2S